MPGSVARGWRQLLPLMAWMAALGALGSAPAAGDGPPGSAIFDNPARAAFRHHRIEAALDPATAALSAVDEVLLVHAAGTPASLAVPFLLHRDLRIESIAAAAPIGWQEHERWDPRDFWNRPQYAELAELDHARQVDLTLPPAAGTWPESLRVTIRYAGTVYDSLQPPPESYQRGFETTRGLIDPRGAYLTGGTFWYPERFDAPFTFDLTARVPPGWQSVSQGARDGDAWRCDQPMDGIYLIAGPYVLREELHNGIALQTFTYGNDDEELCARYLAATRDYLALYSERIGPYPFPKFAMVENFWQTGYGMPSFTLLGDRVVRLPWILATSYGHEILHNWWGNGVFVDYESGNWCEGLTVYGADYLYKERESARAAIDYRRTTLQGYLDYTRAGRDFPLTEFRERHDASSAAIGYGKAMMLYHMLRRRLGDEAFWSALSDIYATHRFRRADWLDLLGAFEQRAGGALDLRSVFYEQWIARTGAPLLALAAAERLPRADGAWDVRYRITQSEPCYDLALPVRATFADGSSEVWTVELTGTEREETHTLTGRPTALAVDPEFDLFRLLHGAEVPAAFSRLNSADSLTLVLAGDGSLGRGIAAGEKRARAALDETQIGPDLRPGAVWLLGEPRWMDRLTHPLPPEVRIEPERFSVGGETYDRATHALVLAVPHPGDADEALGLLLAADAEQADAIWSKLPHYGKYSYLVFAGTQNVASGSWSTGPSPLTAVWGEEE